MKRVVDKPYCTYSVYRAISSGLNVKCPKCHSFAIVTAEGNTVFSDVQTADIQKQKSAQFTVIVSIINVIVVDGTIVWTFKM